MPASSAQALRGAGSDVSDDDVAAMTDRWRWRLCRNDRGGSAAQATFGGFAEDPQRP
jgi:hypothetical protein